MNDLILLEKTRDIRLISFNNPPMNYVSCALLENLLYYLKEFQRDDSAKALILKGNIRGSFLTHYDLKETIEYCKESQKKGKVSNLIKALFAHFLFSFSKVSEIADNFVCSKLSFISLSEKGFYLWIRCLKILENLEKPVFAAINGICLGGALEIALKCDFRFMADNKDYRIGFPEILAGLIPGGGGSIKQLSFLIGGYKAKELLLTGKLLTPSDAKEIGLINEISDEALLIEKVIIEAEHIIKFSKPAISSLKKYLRYCAERTGYSTFEEYYCMFKILSSEETLKRLEWCLENLILNVGSLKLNEMLEKYQETIKPRCCV